MKTSTALEYFQAGPNSRNAATEAIDQGMEPHLKIVELEEAGLYAFREIWDVGSELEEGRIVLYTQSHRHSVVEPDRIIYWR